MNSDFIGGRNAVLESLKNKRLAADTLLVAETASGARIDEAKVEANRREIPIQSVKQADIDELTRDGSHQGIALEVQELHPHTLDDLLTRPARFEYGRLLVADQIQDPVNLGKLSRSALYFGFDGIIKTKDRTAPLSSTVIQTSAGAAARIPIAQAKNLQRALERLKDERYWLVGTVPDSERSIETVPRDRNIGLILGNEETGLRRLTRELCDYEVSIRGAGTFDSLNVANAAAVATYVFRAENWNE